MITAPGLGDAWGTGFGPGSVITAWGRRVRVWVAAKASGGVVHNLSQPLSQRLLTSQALPMSQRSDVAAIVKRQDGLITRQQAVQAGITPTHCAGCVPAASG